MTEIEFSQVEDMLQANYQFLDFTNSALHELWYDSLKRFDVIEVKDGVRKYMEFERTTPTLADLLQYIRPIREKRVEEYEHNVNLLLKDAVKCKACKDRGYILIRYPTGYEAVKPCDCDAGHLRFGKRYWDNVRDTWTNEEVTAYFGESDPAEARNKADKAKVYQSVRKAGKGLVVWEYIQ